LRQLRTDYADTVVALDADAQGNARLEVWRPFASKRIEGALDRLRGWRYEEKAPRSQTPIPMLLADHPDHPRPLEFELRPGSPLSEELRTLAPDAVAAAERSLA